jgi:hypothetical protein
MRALLQITSDWSGSHPGAARSRTRWTTSRKPTIPPLRPLPPRRRAAADRAVVDRAVRHQQPLLPRQHRPLSPCRQLLQRVR